MTASNKLLRETRLISRYFQAAPTSVPGLLGTYSCKDSSLSRYFGFDGRKGAFADLELSAELHSPCGYKFQLQPTHGSTSSVVDARGPKPFSASRIDTKTEINTSK